MEDFSQCSGLIHVVVEIDTRSGTVEGSRVPQPLRTGIQRPTGISKLPFQIGYGCLVKDCFISGDMGRGVVVPVNHSLSGTLERDDGSVLNVGGNVSVGEISLSVRRVDAFGAFASVTGQNGGDHGDTVIDEIAVFKFGGVEMLV